MTHRLVNSARSFAFFSALKAGLKKAKISVRHPEPLRRDLAEDENDAWMFDRDTSPVSAEAYVLETEYSRISGALSGLRGVLSQLSSLPAAAEATLAATAPPPFSARYIAEPMLFDGEDCPPVEGVLPFEDSELFVEHSFSLPRIPARLEELKRVA